MFAIAFTALARFQKFVQGLQFPQAGGETFLDLADVLQFRDAEVAGKRRQLHLEVRRAAQLPIQKPVHAARDRQLQSVKLTGIQLFDVTPLNVGKDFRRPLHPAAVRIRIPTSPCLPGETVGFQNPCREFFFKRSAFSRPRVLIFQCQPRQPIQGNLEPSAAGAVTRPAHQLEQFRVTERDARSGEIIFYSSETQQRDQHLIFEWCGKAMLRRGSPCQFARHGFFQVGIVGMHHTHQLIEAFAIRVQRLLVLQRGDREIDQVQFVPTRGGRELRPVLKRVCWHRHPDCQNSGRTPSRLARPRRVGGRC